MSFFKEMKTSCFAGFFAGVSQLFSTNIPSNRRAFVVGNANGYPEVGVEVSAPSANSKKVHNEDASMKQDVDGLDASVNEEDRDDDGELDDEEMDDEEYDYLQTWGPILAIPDNAFVQLAQRILPSTLDEPTEDFKVVKRTAGSYNHAVIMENDKTSIVVKVPVVGTIDRWKPEHGFIMASEAHTMMHIKNKLPRFPIPKVLGFDKTFENELGAPYTIHSFMKGVPSDLLWYDRDEDDEDDVDAADWPSPARERLRVAFLRSLARHMAELRELEFDSIGMIFFEDDNLDKPKIGPYYGWQDCGLEADRMYYERPVFTTAAEYYKYRLDDRFEPNDHVQELGLRFILECIFKSAPFASSKKNPDDEMETFTIAHNDLAFQNILVDPETGEVTGIIDWDSVGTVPRCVGHTTVPFFLQRDWQLDYVLPEKAILSPWTLNRYRKVYAETMMEVCGGPESDAKYTEKSGMYGVIQLMIYGGGDAFFHVMANDMVAKLMLEIPLLRRYGAEEFQAMVGKGWPEAREVLEEWMPKVIDYRNV